MYCRISPFIFVWVCITMCKSELQAGPDPWHLDGLKVPAKIHETDLPPDLRIPLKKEKLTETKYGFGEWWFKRLLAIMLKSGQVKKSEDGDIDISLRMRFNEDKLKELDECLKSESTLSDIMFRRSVGYVEDAIYKPTITEQIVMAWTDYIQVYLTEYKTYITWSFGILGSTGIMIWLWKHVSHKHIIVIIFVLLYIYEAIISYKEAEQQEYQKFMTAVNTCKWYFWTSECAVPAPDFISFMKHMNPSKIAIRMFTSFISEPVLAINSTIKIILEDITDGLWFPFNKIIYGLLIVVINISLIFFLIMIVFNLIFNISFDSSFLGIVKIGVKKNRSSVFSTDTQEQQQQRTQPVEDTDKISGDRLDKFLNVCKLALTNAHITPQANTKMQLMHNTNIPKIKRSSSTGRLASLCSSENSNYLTKESLRRRHNYEMGDGDN